MQLLLMKKWPWHCVRSSMVTVLPVTSCVIIINEEVAMQACIIVMNEVGMQACVIIMNEAG